MLKIKNFSKTYKNGKRAVDNLTLEIRPGDIYGFIGHNGAGKTTTLRSVAGALDFEDGDILIGGISIKTDPLACKRMMAYIPDNPELYENLTGIQYIKFISDIYGVSKSERQAGISKYGDAFELTHNLGDLISSYSHGMKQKLAVISALIHKPRLLLLDEPFVGLDPKAAYTLKQFIAELCAEGSAVFFSTHVLDTAEKLCNRIAIIKEGRLVAEGDMETVKGDTSLENVFLELTDNG
jgi:ABC-2 type transport system ATP-binding protein